MATSGMKFIRFWDMWGYLRGFKPPSWNEVIRRVGAKKVCMPNSYLYAKFHAFIHIEIRSFFVVNSTNYYKFWFFQKLWTGYQNHREENPSQQARYKPKSFLINNLDWVALFTICLLHKNLRPYLMEKLRWKNQKN